MLDNTLEKLKNNKLSKSHIQGIHTYDILRNPAYIDAFQYVAAKWDRKELIQDDDDDDENNAYQSDLVRLVLNLAYMTDADFQTYEFTKEAMVKKY